MTDDVLEPVDGFEIMPSLNASVPGVFIVIEEFYKNGPSIQTRALSPDEARGLARLIGADGGSCRTRLTARPEVTRS